MSHSVCGGKSSEGVLASLKALSRKLAQLSGTVFSSIKSSMLNCTQYEIEIIRLNEVNLREEDVHNRATPKLLSQAFDGVKEASSDVVFPPVGQVCLEDQVHHHGL